MRGEFTRKMDKDILKKIDEETDKKLSKLEKKEMEKAKLNEIQKQLNEICDVFRARSQFLRDRFSNFKESNSTKGLGVIFHFEKTDDHPYKANIEFCCKDNEIHEAIFVDSSMEIEGKLDPIKDYISFPVGELDFLRIKKFVEQKILDFMDHYMKS